MFEHSSLYRTRMCVISLQKTPLRQVRPLYTMLDIFIHLCQTNHIIIVNGKPTRLNYLLFFQSDTYRNAYAQAGHMLYVSLNFPLVSFAI